MKIVAIIQARMGSTRLPGKVLMDLGGATVLARVVSRVCRSELVQEVLVATSSLPHDDAIVCECRALGVASFRGSETDVLDRYHRAARHCSAQLVVRVTCDCPLIQPELIDDVVCDCVQQQADYASNVLQRAYPRGLDAEAFTASALQRAWQEAREPHQREHVTPYFCEHPELFKLSSTVGEQDLSCYRWTLDTIEDLELIRTIYARFRNRDDIHWQEVVMLMNREPELAELNLHVLQKSASGDR